jgi:hypothetical protein
MYMWSEVERLERRRGQEENTREAGAGRWESTKAQ